MPEKRQWGERDSTCYRERIPREHTLTLFCPRFGAFLLKNEVFFLGKLRQGQQCSWHRVSVTRALQEQQPQEFCSPAARRCSAEPSFLKREQED